MGFDRERWNLVIRSISLNDEMPNPLNNCGEISRSSLSRSFRNDKESDCLKGAVAQRQNNQYQR